MSERHPQRGSKHHRSLLLLVLSLLMLTFRPASATEGVVVSWTDGTTSTLAEPADSDAVRFGSTAGSDQLRVIYVSRAALPATVIDFALEGFRPTRLEVLDLDGEVVRTLADGLWAEGAHRMAWHHDTDQGRRLEDGIYVLRLSVESPATDSLALAR